MRQAIRIDRSLGEFFYAPDVTPRAHVTPGTALWLETRDPRSGALFNNAPGTLQAYPPPPGGNSNALTGPIYVEGAAPGDTLVVQVTDLILGSLGWMGARDNGQNLPIGSIGEARIYLAPIADGQVAFLNGLTFPVRPHIGCVGVADAARPTSGQMGAFGGNMDHALLAPGCTLYLPITVPGALLYVGDVHAAMGDGEVTAVAVEVPAEVGLTVDLVKNYVLPGPRLETADRVVTTGWAMDFTTARQMAVRDMVHLLQTCLRLSPVEAMMLISAAADLRIGQACGGMDLSLRLEMPKFPGLTAVPA